MHSCGGVCSSVCTFVRRQHTRPGKGGSRGAVQEYHYHIGAVNTVTYIEENRMFVSSADDKTLRVWELGVPVQVKVRVNVFMLVRKRGPAAGVPESAPAHARARGARRVPCCMPREREHRVRLWHATRCLPAPETLNRHNARARASPIVTPSAHSGPPPVARRWWRIPRCTPCPRSRGTPVASSSRSRASTARS